MEIKLTTVLLTLILSVAPATNAAPAADNESNAQAETALSPLQVVLERNVFFSNSGGEVAEIPAGTYVVTGAGEDAIALGGETESFQLHATGYAHDELIGSELALSFTESDDVHHVTLLDEEGNGLVAIGSYSGVIQRALPTLSSTPYRTQVKAQISRTSLYAKTAYRPRPEDIAIKYCPEQPFLMRGATALKCSCPSGTAKALLVEAGYMGKCLSPSDRFHMTVMLDRVIVHDDCDDLSEGDWKMIVVVGTRDERAVISPRIAWWPSKWTVKGVNGGRRYENPNRVVNIHDIRADQDIEIGINGIDCDGNFISNFSLIGMAIEAYDNAPKYHCGGEEVWELSGDSDRLGKTRRIWPGETDVVEYTRSFYLRGSTNNQCTDGSAYSAYFVVSRTAID